MESNEERHEALVTSGEDDDEVKEPVEPEPWVRIQRTTFTNWINVKLREKPGMEVRDLQSDFQDGILLCRLMEVLTGRPLPGKVVVKAHLNAYEVGGNLGLALDAMKHDGIRLVNIGPEDISGGNLKLILGLVWLLIRHYQIGMSGSGHSSTQLPSKAMMLSWVNAALRPHLTVTNFTRDWNNGRALLGLIEFCRPGTCKTWYNLDSDDDNQVRCDHALKLAEKWLRVPLVLSGEHLASPELDEQSTLTYLSYFMAVNSPGYKATLRWVQRQIAPVHVLNFYSSWNSGDVALALVNSFLTEPIEVSELSTAEEKCLRAVEVSEQQLGVPHVISGRDLASPDVDYLSIMAYAAWHRPEYQQPIDELTTSTDALPENLLDDEDIIADSTNETSAPANDDTDLACDADTNRNDLDLGADTDGSTDFIKGNDLEDGGNVKIGDEDEEAGPVHVEEEVEEEMVASQPVLHTHAEKPAPAVLPEPEYRIHSETAEAVHTHANTCTQPRDDTDVVQRYLPLLILLLAIIILHLINRFVNRE